MHVYSSLRRSDLGPLIYVAVIVACLTVSVVKIPPKFYSKPEQVVVLDTTKKKAETVLPKRQLDCLIKNAYYEAGNQGELGRALVNQVVVNRARLWKKSYCSVIYQKKQFSWTLFRNSPIPKEEYRKIKQEVIDFFKHPPQIPKRFKEATHYHASYVNPYWSDDIQYLGAYKHHKFYKAQI